MPKSPLDTRDDANQDQPALGRALRELYHPRLEIPRGVDETIERAAAARLGRAATTGGRWWRVVAGGAVAAALAGALWLGSRTNPRPPPPPAQPIAGMDLDGSGHIDILDAFDLARRLETGEPLAPALDLNADGVVDGGDVDMIAMEAVSLRGGAGS